ncbi:hypothetical protein SASPL_130468 [Salvia splendens]|uniref:Calponin-homology (CH) domain-containing protein n=1 Tax=Salvia splendens TaxID=180675 RepID=A0A8X8ZJH0_SALSN|nr:hypothetical protein SASPL_130468 [Salvia splendens]
MQSDWDAIDSLTRLIETGPPQLASVFSVFCLPLKSLSPLRPSPIAIAFPPPFLQEILSVAQSKPYNADNKGSRNQNPIPQKSRIVSTGINLGIVDRWGCIAHFQILGQFTQVELQGLKSKFEALKNENGKVTVGDIPSLIMKLKSSNDVFNEEEIRQRWGESHSDINDEVDFESFLRSYEDERNKANEKSGGSKTPSSFLKATTTTLLHTIHETERASYVAHINIYLRDDPFLKQFLPMDPSTNALFDLAKGGVLLCKLINVAVPGTIDERAINTKKVLNPWERNENHTLCLNSAKAIGCTVVNIGTQDLVEGRPHLVLGLISQIIKIQLLADLNLRKTPQLLEIVDDNTDVEELMSLAPEKLLLKWMNFHLKKGGYKKTVTNFSSDLKFKTVVVDLTIYCLRDSLLSYSFHESIAVAFYHVLQDGEAYAYLLNVLGNTK